MEKEVTMKKNVIRTVHDLEVYNLSYLLAREIHHISKGFPRDETYSLTDQIRRSSRSVAANITEGFAKKYYPNVFKKHLYIAIGSSEETKTWLDFAKDFTYLNAEEYLKLSSKYTELGAMLYRLIQNWR
jgi:four helix bundle protein